METLLQARGLTGRTLTETREAVRKIAAHSAAEESADVGEILAGKVLARVDALGAAKGAAGSYVYNAIEKAKRG